MFGSHVFFSHARGKCHLWDLIIVVVLLVMA
jgi:hypothetical protein